MEKKRNLSGKTILKIIGAAISALIFALCINAALNDLNIWMWRRKITYPMILLAFVPFLAVFFLDAYVDLGIAGIFSVIAAFAIPCGMALIPPLLNRQIARSLEKEGLSGKSLLRRIEWIRFYPLKKLLICGLWGFGGLLLVLAAGKSMVGILEPDGEMVFFLLLTLVLMAVFFPRVKKYAANPCHCAPVLNEILTKKQMEELLDGERFERIAFQDADMKRYVDIYRSRNWMVIEGRLISKKLAFKTAADSREGGSTITVLYLNGQSVKAKVPLNAYRYPEFDAVWQELTGISTPLILKNRREQAGRKFQELFPECPSERERMYAFLSHDAEQVKQDYAAFFAPQPRKKNKKKKEETI